MFLRPVLICAAALFLIPELIAVSGEAVRALTGGAPKKAGLWAGFLAEWYAAMAFTVLLVQSIPFFAHELNWQTTIPLWIAAYMLTAYPAVVVEIMSPPFPSAQAPPARAELPGLASLTLAQALGFALLAAVPTVKWAWGWVPDVSGSPVLWTAAFIASVLAVIARRRWLAAAPEISSHDDDGCPVLPNAHMPLARRAASGNSH